MMPLLWTFIVASLSVGARAQGFDLSDAFDTTVSTTWTVPASVKPKSPVTGEAVPFVPESSKQPPKDLETRKPTISHPSKTDTGPVGDSDLEQHGGDSEPDAGSGPVAGILSAVGVAILGAATSFFAYQKKKWCFKVQGGDPERADKNIQENQTEPQVLSNLQNTA
ncbi:CD99 antigen-like protein 2 isoform X2 [Scleropages formosus]|uniref:CD99 antigen-like protein 2 isoform X2 n=1 Tax=Scleropages formosus TaxID=113540 RepID=UPI0010FAA394|nr:CD99 antigen-like protein 2 isoform X2 [Scleropages formosus]